MSDHLTEVAREWLVDMGYTPSVVVLNSLAALLRREGAKAELRGKIIANERLYRSGSVNVSCAWFVEKELNNLRAQLAALDKEAHDKPASHGEKGEG